ncbi:50S small subunit ribosomal protein L1 [Cryptococcus bacillisporus CA1873]|uniref:Ribosomal protein n=1 Tax=Cryptococcus bacillisporus CA1873 TaxID=1296111 RepID=A0ABR5BF72_CRYGA|nr:50S small subunit ribosomal protein L1 [Cryptococcus bacillisporus CA1873]|eukprot:KIR67814.1 50S small subunit ribosomal protein L1 [Cryptococcus gattii CA1873]
MISSSIRIPGKLLAQVARPAVASASFSTTATVGARVQSKQSKKKVANPNALSASEATRVLRALEVAHPTSTYSLTLHTKSHKSALPIRGSFILPLDPRRTSETILVFAEPSSPSATFAKEAGAAYVGGDELFEAVLSGKIQPTRCLATPGMMPAVSRALARFLGPKGLMPVAKRGGVAEGEELAERIRDAAGKMEYRADKQGTVKINVARVDFGIPSVETNIKSFIQTVRDNQAAANQTDDPLAAAGKSKKKKGSSITSVILESTNGPSIELNDVL